MKYVIFLTKHHDGFCMFDSALTEYDIMSTPLGRDVTRELAEARHRGNPNLLVLLATRLASSGLLHREP